MFEKTLIVVAHPDDEVLGCGGTLAKFSTGNNFKVISIAEGSTCRFNSTNDFEALKAIEKNISSKRNEWS